jgi:hypothetical protein
MAIDEQPSEDVLRRLVEEAQARGEDSVVVEATPETADAWRRAGFSERARILEAPIAALEHRLGDERKPSFGSIHVQTDDIDAVVRGVRQFVPRMPGNSQGSVVSPPRNGWVTVYDELADSPIAWGRSSSYLASRRARSFDSCSSSAVGSWTSTCRCPSTTASSRLGT